MEKAFQKHVEDCSGLTPTRSRSVASTLSSLPPGIGSSQEVNDEGDDLLSPYVPDSFKFYPVRKENADATGDDATEVDDFYGKVRLSKITDPDEIIESLEDFEDMPFDKLYRRVVNAQASLVAWQDEWMDYEHWVKTTEHGNMNPVMREKIKDTNFGIKNPRAPKPSQTGQGYQDMIESFVYGYEHNPHPSKVGQQDPISQRYYEAGSGKGRHLRQRVPTKKAVEGDVSESPENELTGKRNRRQPLPFENGARSSSRLSSETVDPPPKSTFASGKRRGRPPTKKPGAQRIVELQREHGSEIHSNSSRSPLPGSSSRSAAYPGQNTAVRSTEWDEATDSRPNTSASASSGATTETDADQSDDEDDTNPRRRGRQQTSDFETNGLKVRPYKIGTFTGPSKFSTEGLEHLTPEEIAAKKKKFDDKQRAWATRRKNKARQEALARGEQYISDSDGNGAGIQGTGKAKSISSQHHGSAKRKSSFAKRRDVTDDDDTDEMTQDEVTAGKSNATGPTTKATSKAHKNQKSIAKKAEPSTPGAPKEKKEKGTTAASRNMMERWRKKKEAEALGLPAPAIGRYPKGSNGPKRDKSVKVEGSQSVPPPILPATKSAKVGDKRKRTDEDAAAENGDETSNDAPPTKKRGRAKAPAASQPADDAADVADESAAAENSNQRSNEERPSSSYSQEVQGVAQASDVDQPSSKKRGGKGGNKSKSKVAVKEEKLGEKDNNPQEENLSLNTVDGPQSQASVAASTKKRAGETKKVISNVVSGENTPETQVTSKHKGGIRFKVISTPSTIQNDENEQGDNSGTQTLRRTGRAKKPTAAALESRPNSSAGPVEEATVLPAKESDKKKESKKRKPEEEQPIVREPSSIAETKPKRLRKRPAHFYDGAADDDDEDESPAPKRRNIHSSFAPQPLVRKMSEYEEYQALSSPTPSDLDRKRGRRSAALRARQSFGAVETEDEEDVQSQVEQQFASEYDRYQALASPRSPAILGKRKRKPVINMEQVLRMEAGNEDEFED